MKAMRIVASSFKRNQYTMPILVYTMITLAIFFFGTMIRFMVVLGLVSLAAPAASPLAAFSGFSSDVSALPELVSTSSSPPFSVPSSPPSFSDPDPSCSS
jgi:hypothetical protein